MDKTSAVILSIETEVPSVALQQECFSDLVAQFIGLTDSQTRVLSKIALGSQIQKRHTVITDYLESDGPNIFFGAENGDSLPKTGKRNELYKCFAPELARSVCQKTLDHWGGNKAEITHLISVSCTGMMAPGIEFLLINSLGLSPNVERLGINFMGCFGAFKGIAIAKALALESPHHRVLVVCTELCSLHFQEDLNMDTMVGNAIFSDGAAAVIIGTEPRQNEKPLFKIYKQKSMALKDSLDLMTWEVSDQGFQMRLSAKVPSSLQEHISPFAKQLLGEDISFDQCTWAVHPGGKAILNAISSACNLQKEQLLASWKVLTNYGNMSSPTFLFVLKEVLANPMSKKWVPGFGFGPGLSVEGLLLKRVN